MVWQDVGLEQSVVEAGGDRAGEDHLQVVQLPAEVQVQQ